MLYEEQVDAMLSLTTTLNDTELVEELTALKILAAETDDLDARFNSALMGVKTTLLARFAG